MVLSRDEILAMRDVRVATVAIPEWGGDVHVRTLTGAEGDKYAALAKENADMTRGAIACLFLADKDGARLFSDDDAVLVGAKSLRALDAVIEAGLQHNGMTDEALDGLEKNSVETLGNGSGSV